MHIGRHIVQELVLTFGQPEILRWDVPLTSPEMDEVERRHHLGRAHDVSVAIVEGNRVAVIRKPGYPEGAFRIPSGGVHPEESFVDGATREALEETGLHVLLDDYIVQVHANFCLDERSVKWTTHVMLARSEGGELRPLDSGEVEAARWIDWRELVEEVNPRLVASGRGGLRYRAQLHEKLSEILHSPRRPAPEPASHIEQGG